jgi:hypothetical protein
LKSEKKAPAQTVTLTCDQVLFPGINYFWVSLEMKPTASLVSKITAEVTEVHMDGKSSIVTIDQGSVVHRMGIGVRHAGVGVRIFLPMIGMMGIDWGYGFDKVFGSKQYGGSQFHFILGQEF